MRTIILIIIASLAISLQTIAQITFPVEFRVEKQSMSTPMTDVEDILFMRSYHMRPVNVSFDGTQLIMKYDNGAIFTKKSLSKVDYETEFEDDALSMETFFYTDNDNTSDAILFVIDYNVGYMEVVLTTKNSKGVNIGYTSYRQYLSGNELAAN
ncbi:MAG: hypothetical protein ACERKD_17565 [Prolixibacteraceae bacterium]